MFFFVNEQRVNLFCSVLIKQSNTSVHNCINLWRMIFCELIRETVLASEEVCAFFLLS